jgi:hypothetical protein
VGSLAATASDDGSGSPGAAVDLPQQFEGALANMKKMAEG